MLGKLVSLAQAHEAAVVCLTDKHSEAGSLGSLVSLRAEAARKITGDAYEVSVRALKDKRRGPGWTRSLGSRAKVGE